MEGVDGFFHTFSGFQWKTIFKIDFLIDKNSDYKVGVPDISTLRDQSLNGGEYSKAINFVHILHFLC